MLQHFKDPGECDEAEPLDCVYRCWIDAPFHIDELLYLDELFYLDELLHDFGVCNG